MSADNCVAILRTTDRCWDEGNGTFTNMFEDTPVWRVKHIQNHDEFDHYLNDERHNLGAWVKAMFDGAPAFTDYDKAFDEAQRLYDELTIVEYGIVHLDMGDMNFPFH